MTYIHAYFEEWSRLPGETARMAISTSCASVQATFVKLIEGPRPDRPMETHPLPDILDRTVAGRHQDTPVGSFATFPLEGAGIGSTWTFHCWFWATVPGRDGVQTVASFHGGGDVLAVILSEGRLALRWNGAVIATVDITVDPMRWYSLCVSHDADGMLSVDIALPTGLAQRRYAHATQATPISSFVPRTLMLASADVDGTGSPIDAYNGKIDRPRLYDTLSLSDRKALHAMSEIAMAPRLEWDSSSDFLAQALTASVSGVADATLHNHVERGVTGHDWLGKTDMLTAAPRLYGALQFHEDRMIESGWDYDFAFDLPSDLPSGAYAVRLDGNGISELYPLFVRALPSDTADILFVFPTSTYLAYANEQMVEDFPPPSPLMPRPLKMTADETAVVEEKVFGLSCYDTHGDGTAVRYSSRRRPILNAKPNSANWMTGSWRHLPVDMFFVEWLLRLGADFHIATDEDLHREGDALISRYRLCLTGSHPEYWSGPARDAVEGFVNDGGKLMYLAGDGFYWITTFDPQRPWIVEVRRDNASTRCWDPPWGERVHTTDLTMGGTWRTRGAGPHALVGVGFAAEGWSDGCGYLRAPASYDPAYARFFAGIENESFGAHGLVLGAAVADEVDRFDICLGSPAHGVVLASSTGLDDAYQLVIDELLLTLPGQGGKDQPKVRSDIVYIPVEGGGEVFTAGSIAFAGGMAWNEFDNDCARLATNVLNAFLKVDAAAEPAIA